jgi:hypothetical protein
MWTYKRNSKGALSSAVVRRMNIVGNLDLSEKENRITFGYCYLEWIGV